MLRNSLIIFNNCWCQQLLKINNCQSLKYIFWWVLTSKFFSEVFKFVEKKQKKKYNFWCIIYSIWYRVRPSLNYVFFSSFILPEKYYNNAVGSIYLLFYIQAKFKVKKSRTDSYMLSNLSDLRISNCWIISETIILIICNAISLGHQLYFFVRVLKVCYRRNIDDIVGILIHSLRLEKSVVWYFYFGKSSLYMSTLEDCC